MKPRHQMLCASQASTAICMSMDRPSSSSTTTTTTIQLGGRAIDRHNPIIRDERRIPKALNITPCTSQPPPINPQPYKQLLQQKKKKTSTTKDGSKSSTSSSTSSAHKHKKFSLNGKLHGGSDVTGSTPHGSTRYLLSDRAMFDHVDPVVSVVDGNSDSHRTCSSITASNDPITSSSFNERPSNQVVVLRVSLHCKGCEGKVRKHLSRMEGVKSFNIDFAAKKVTIVGDVTPLGVLASVSKVKNAQFWTQSINNAAAATNINAEVKNIR